VKSGLENLVEQGAGELGGARVGLCCNPTAVDRDLRHATGVIESAGVRLVRLFGPEHGVYAAAQDMVGVADEGPEVVSLYGDDADSLKPDVSTLEDLDVVLFDIQDIGSRYYTYQATLGFLMERAAMVDTKVVVLDRPNPINGVNIEGNIVEAGFESFVSAYPLAVRHGMTMGEMGHFFRDVVGIDVELEVIPCTGWRRDMWFDETGLPWVFPSPNMPTLETAILYPGMCLIEGTNLSEGRGTTRPFHLLGAPWIDPRRFVDLLRKGAIDARLEGVAFREASFQPGYQKHAGAICGGAEIHITNRDALESFLLGLVVIEAAMRCEPDAFAWRTETYEFIDHPIAIDLLCGSNEARLGLEAHVPPRDLMKAWEGALSEWEEARQSCLIY
jgi:uncharacterized protein YbbC (DUF1343 family)